MTKKKRLELTLRQQIEKKLNAGISEDNPPITQEARVSELGSLEERVEQVLGLINKPLRKKTSMTYFIMYDIENDKVRHLVHKFLIKRGCTRIQRSIFIADTSHEVFDEIKTSLTDIQSFYKNEDSIIIVPISTDHIKAMKVIGQSIDIDLILKNKTTLFF
jgi:CRISPR-associated protein Cas2